ncbi:hypothetical protein C8R47DRAFT_1231538 [Mycena vitilis]|nr:hypothetical protein C8R47DRAFT_1231538 [Mycena vitilis]
MLTARATVLLRAHALACVYTPQARADMALVCPACSTPRSHSAPSSPSASTVRGAAVFSPHELWPRPSRPRTHARHDPQLPLPHNRHSVLAPLDTLARRARSATGTSPLSFAHTVSRTPHRSPHQRPLLLDVAHIEPHIESRNWSSAHITDASLRAVRAIACPHHRHPHPLTVPASTSRVVHAPLRRARRVTSLARGVARARLPVMQRAGPRVRSPCPPQRRGSRSPPSAGRVTSLARGVASPPSAHAARGPARPLTVPASTSRVVLAPRYLPRARSRGPARPLTVPASTSRVVHAPLRRARRVTSLARGVASPPSAHASRGPARPLTVPASTSRVVHALLRRAHCLPRVRLARLHVPTSTHVPRHPRIRSPSPTSCRDERAPVARHVAPPARRACVVPPPNLRTILPSAPRPRTTRVRHPPTTGIGTTSSPSLPSSAHRRMKMRRTQDARICHINSRPAGLGGAKQKAQDVWHWIDGLRGT